MIMPAATTRSTRLLRRVPILLIAVAAVVVLVFFRRWLSFDWLEHHSARLLAMRDQHYLATSLGFILLYTLIVVISVPGAVVLTLAGGFLFGLFPGVFYNMTAATLGAVIVFLAARSGFGHDIAVRIEARGGAVARLQQALREHQITVLLTMRLIPVVPFFVANIVPALVGVRFWTFVATTFVGIIPADVIYTQLGAGLGAVFARGERPDLRILLKPEFAVPMVALVVLAMLPLVYKLFTRKA